MSSNALASWLSSIAIGVLISVLSGCIGGLLGGLCVDWHRVSSREGGSGYLVLFFILLGAVAGFIIGVVAARMSVGDSDPNFLRGLWRGAAAAVGLGLVLTSVAWFTADIPPKRNGRPFVVEVEVKHPKNSPIKGTHGRAPTVTLMTDTRGKSGGYGELNPFPEGGDAGHGALKGAFELTTESPSKSLVISDGENSSIHFPMPLGAKPGGRDEEWSQWIGPEWLYRQGKFAKPGTDDTFAYRYRVRLEEPKPEVPKVPEISAEDKANAEFAALTPDSLLIDWIPHTAHGTPQARLEKALESIRRRPGMLKEIRDYAFSAEPRDTEAAMHLMAHLNQPTPEFAPVVTEIGRDIVQRLERGVQITPQEDESYDWAADISIRFHGWIEAARILRDKGIGDYSEELRSMLKLGRKRPDSRAMQSDVVRVASYYMQKWTGEAPDPSDPKPR